MSWDFSDGGGDPSGFQQFVVDHSDRTGRVHDCFLLVDRPDEVHCRIHGLDVHHRRRGHARLRYLYLSLLFLFIILYYIIIRAIFFFDLILTKSPFFVKTVRF